jgi:hypothetical protein
VTDVGPNGAGQPATPALAVPTQPAKTAVLPAEGQSVVSTHHVPVFHVAGVKGPGEEAASSEGSGSLAESVRPMVSSRGAPPVMPQAAPGDAGLRRIHPNGYSHHGGSDDDDGDDDDGAEVPDMPKVARNHVPKDLQQYVSCVQMMTLYPMILPIVCCTLWTLISL